MGGRRERWGDEHRKSSECARTKAWVGAGGHPEWVRPVVRARPRARRQVLLSSVDAPPVASPIFSKAASASKRERQSRVHFPSSGVSAFSFSFASLSCFVSFFALLCPMNLSAAWRTLGA